MNNILVFGASNSRHSINKQLAMWAASQLEETGTTLLDLNDFEMPIFSVDRELEDGIPDLAHQFKDEIRMADGIIISFAEHNGAYSTAFKNIFDWISRIEKDVWLNKPMFLMATSPGARGGATVLGIALNKFKFMNKNTIASFSLPAFKTNFSTEGGILDPELKKEFNNQLQVFNAAVVERLIDADAEVNN